MRDYAISNVIFNKSPKSEFFALMSFKSNIAQVKCIVCFEIFRCGNFDIIFELHCCYCNISIHTYTAIIFFAGFGIQF